MASNSINNNLERLEEQLFAYKPSLKSKEQKVNVSKRLREQLLDSKAVVKIQRMDAECESLMISLKQRLMLLQDILIPKDKEQVVARQQNKEQQDVKLNLSSDSSDEETLSSLMAKRREAEKRKTKISKKGSKEGGKKSSMETQQPDTSETNESLLPLALRRQPRERKLSYKSISSSASTSQSRNNHLSKIQNRQEQTVSTSGVSYRSEEMLVEQEDMDDTPTLHIKIPSLHRGSVHYIILDSLDFARKVFDYRANEVKQQQQQSSITHTTKISKTRKKQIKSIAAAPVLQQLTQQEQELELSQLIQDVMAEACSDETLQATNALESINNNLIDNYESVDQENFITYSQSSQELSFSQNSNTIETVCSTSNVQKKQRKNNKRSTNDEHQLKEPARKRGRKPKKKNNLDNLELQPQPPTKTNLAKYVEFFANDCELMPGSTTPAASSTRSQPLVSSTTQNFEVIDQLGQNQEQQTSPEQHQTQQEQQQAITYYIDGDWANGGPCQLVPTNGMPVDARQLNQDDMNAPFQDFVNYIDNSVDSGNNVIARVLESNHSLPISIPLPIANLGLQNKTLQQTQNLQQTSLPVINIQIPSLPNTSTAPPPAHNHKEVLDLSIKTKTNYNSLNNNEVLNLNHKSKDLNNSCFMAALEDDCLPLDLSKKTGNNINNCTNTITIDNQDEEFIRRLIEQSEFQYNNDEFKKSNEDNILVYEQANDKSFKAALDMPLLDFDAHDLAELVDNGTEQGNKRQDNITDKINYTDTTNNEDSNYVTMSAVNSALHFSDNSTSDIFNKLLDICPDNQFLDNINQEFSNNDDLSESVFEQCRIENSTMLELEKTINEKNLMEKEQNNEICNKTLDNPDKEPLPSSTDTSLAVQLDSSNNISSDISINLKFNENINLTDKIQNQQYIEIIDLSQESIKDTQPTLNEKEPKDFVKVANKDKQNELTQSKNLEEQKAAQQNSIIDREKDVIDRREEMINLSSQDSVNDIQGSLNEASVKKDKPNDVKQTKNEEHEKESQQSSNIDQEKDDTEKDLIDLSEEMINLSQNSLNDMGSLNITKIKEFEGVVKKDQLNNVQQTKNEQKHKSSNINQEKEDPNKTTKVNINSNSEIDKQLETEQQKGNKTEDVNDVKTQQIENNLENPKSLQLTAEIERRTSKKSLDKPTKDIENDKQKTKDMEMDNEITENSRISSTKETEEDIEMDTEMTETQDLCTNNKFNVEHKKIIKSNKIKTYSNKCKTKENVVFSVAKITLSEDDHLFITDSDTSSGKSFDANETYELEKVEKSNNSQQNIKPNEEEPKYTKEHIKSPRYDRISNPLYEEKTQDTQMLLASNKPLNSSTKIKSNDELNEYDKYKEDNLKSKANSPKNEKESLQQDSDNQVVAINLKSPQKENDKSSQILQDIESPETFVLSLSSPIYLNESSSQLNEENENVSQTLPNENESYCSEILNLSITSRQDNNTESSTEDLIILNIDEEDFTSDKSPDVQNNMKDENAKDTISEKEIDVSVSDVVTKDDEKPPCKDLNENNKQLTLLELESKLEDSLDFEEDYDDTLSLATSCFDSPTDDRFEDSTIVEDSTMVEDSTNKFSSTTKPVETQPITNVIANQPQLNKDLKHFKIPKITHISPKENKTVQEPKEPITEKEKLSEAPPPPTSTNQMPKIIINLEKITRTVKNDLVPQPSTASVSLNQNCFDVLQPPLQNETPTLVKILQKVFGITCLPFLIDKCYAITHCQQSHQFNDVDCVYQILNTLDKFQVNSSYMLMYNHVKLYKLYFQTFCTYYTNKHDRVKLLNMINDCERYPEYAEFIIMVYESLVNCGLSRVNACRLILKRIRETSVASTIIEALVAIIMKSDWTMFTDIIEKYTQEVYKFNYRITTLEQMAPAVLNSKGPHLKQIFGKCVQTLHPNDTCQLLNSPVLIQCVALLTTNT